MTSVQKNTASFRVILVKINEEFRNLQQEIGSALAHTFRIEEKQALKAMSKLPVVLFDNITIDDVKRLKDSVTFLSKLGLILNVTPQQHAEVRRTGWTLQKLTPIIQCPSCGDSFLMVSASGCLGGELKTSSPKTKEQKDDISSISAEFEEVDALSAELESIVNMDGDDEIEEIGSVSEELEEIGSFSEELEKISDISEELDKITNLEAEDHSEIEDIGGISAEFEEIDGVSAEFENISLESLGEDIGSLSAELEEIESISGEFDTLSDNRP